MNECPNDRVATDAPRRPLSPAPEALVLAQEILGSRFEADHKHINAFLAALRANGLPIELACFGPRAVDAKPVVLEVADRNLRAAAEPRIRRRIESINRKIGGSVAATVNQFDSARLGGSGAAGRQRDRARASEVRNILRSQADRLQAELDRRANEAAQTLHHTDGANLREEPRHE